MKRPLILGLIALVFFIHSKTYAQQKNFSGTWLMKDQQSISGNLYTNGAPIQVTIKQSGKGMDLEYITSEGKNDTTNSETFGAGKVFETRTAMGRKKVVVLAWTNDGNSFSEKATVYSLADAAKIDGIITDVWTIENGQLILDRKNENLTNGETWELKTVYARQNTHTTAISLTPTEVHIRLAQYEQNKDWKQYAALVNEMIKLHPPAPYGEGFPRGEEFKKATMLNGMGPDTWNLNWAAWMLFQKCDDRSVLRDALKWSELSIELDSQIKDGPNGEYVDTKANLLYKIGKTKEGIAVEEALYRKGGGKAVGMAETIAKMKAGQPTW